MFRQFFEYMITKTMSLLQSDMGKDKDILSSLLKNLKDFEASVLNKIKQKRKEISLLMLSLLATMLLSLGALAYINNSATPKDPSPTLSASAVASLSTTVPATNFPTSMTQPLFQKTSDNTPSPTQKASLTVTIKTNQTLTTQSSREPLPSPTPVPTREPLPSPTLEPRFTTTPCPTDTRGNPVCG